MKVLLVLEVVLLFSQAMGWGGGSNDRVLLRDMTAITLERGKETMGRRASPVPQLSCKGGTTGCQNSYLPRTVQCLNRGSDGSDVQWECKADLDRAVQFGRIQVSCEGYEYPDDPYVLKGSCGLEYELDSTSDGRHGSSNYGSGPNTSYGSNKGNGAWVTLVQIVIVAAFAYWLYQCVKGAQHRQQAPPTPSAGYNGSSGYSSNSGSYTAPPGGAGGGGGGPGFWSGAATGGLLGYLFGNRGGTGYGGGYGGGHGGGASWGRYGGGRSAGGFGRSSGWSTGGGSGWGSGGGSSSKSSGSRSTSGFGGTSRR